MFAKLSPWQNYNEFFISVVYFVQGSGGITSIASALILREQLGLDFYQMGLIGVASLIPWMIKPIYGILTDLVPIGGYRRKPYLHIGPVIAVAGFLTIGFFGTTFSTFFLALVIANLGLALTDVATDGFIVEETDKENAARLQGLAQGSIRVAAFITAFFSGLLIFQDILTPHQMYIMQAFFPAFTFICSFWIKEAKDQGIIGAITGAIEDKITERVDLKIFTPALIATLLVIFTALVLHMAFPQIDEFFTPYLGSNAGSILNVLIWGAYAIWMLYYFLKLKKLKLTTGFIFIALAFILLWRFNPGVGSPMFFYVKDTLGITEKTLGFIDTTSQVGSILGVFLAVMIFDKIHLRKLLAITVIVAGIFGITSFAITRPEFGEAIGGSFLVTWFSYIISAPTYFAESLFNGITGGGWENPIHLIGATSTMERFLFIQSIIGEVLFMIAYIPLLKLAVLVTPKRAEATNYAVIASIMNVGIALSGWASGYLYNFFMGIYHPTLEVSSVQIDIIEILIWINIITSFTCLIVVPFMRTDQLDRKDAI
jgi:MFS family permease